MITTVETTAVRTRSPDAEADGAGVSASLGWFALAVIVGMHAGTIFKPLGSVGSTRVADWIDLLTPFAVLGCAALVLGHTDAGRGRWVLLMIGGTMFALGKGLHIAANSVSNVADPDVAGASVVHLWDEVVSHYIWFTGLFLILATLAIALRDHDVAFGAFGRAAALLLALTLFNTYVEGGTPWMGMGYLITAVMVGVRWHPAPVASVLMLIGGSGLVLLVGWGVYWYAVDESVFPQFSELGWI